jgi:hypothetical protein
MDPMKIRLTLAFALFFLLTALPARVAGMDEPVTSDQDQTTFNIDSLSHTPQVMRDLMKSIQSGWSALSNTAKNFQKERDHAKWQNTVVVAHPKVPVALYKRDLIELPLFATDLALAYWFFYTFKQNRINYIYTEMTTNADWYLAEFEKFAQIDQNCREIQQSARTFSEKITQQEELIKIAKTMFEEIASRHHYLGSNPFKKELLLPFLAALAGHKLTSIAKGKLLVQQSFTPEALFAYNPDGSVFNLDTTWQPSPNQASTAINDMTYRPAARYEIMYRDNKKSQTRDKRVTQDIANKYPCTGLTPAQIIEQMNDIEAVFGPTEGLPLAEQENFCYYLDSGYIAKQQPLTPAESAEVANKSLQGSQTLIKEAIKGLTFWHGAPISISSFIKSFFIANPNAPTLDYGPPMKRILETFGNGIQHVIPEGAVEKAWYHLLGLPSWFYPLFNNPVSSKIISGTMMVASLYVANAAYQKEWLTLMGKEYPQLQTLLIAHKATAHLPDTDRDKQRVARDLKKLIARGNTVTGNGIQTAITELFNLKFLGTLTVQSKMSAWIFTMINACMLAKLAKTLPTAVPQLRLAHKAGWINPQALFATPIGPIILIYAAYFGLIYSVVAFAQAATVVSDIKNMYGSIKQRFVKPSAQKNEEEETSESNNEKTKEQEKPMEESHERVNV